MAITAKDSLPTTLKGISGNHGRFHPQFARTGAAFVASPFWMLSKWKSRKRLHHIALLEWNSSLLGRSRSGVGIGVGVDTFRLESESEPELLEIGRLRSPGHMSGTGQVKFQNAAFSHF